MNVHDDSSVLGIMDEDTDPRSAAAPSLREHPAQQMTMGPLPTPRTNSSTAPSRVEYEREGESDFSVDNAFQGAFDGLEFDFDSMSSDPFSWFTGYRVNSDHIDALASMGD